MYGGNRPQGPPPADWENRPSNNPYPEEYEDPNRPHLPPSSMPGMTALPQQQYRVAPHMDPYQNPDPYQGAPPHMTFQSAPRQRTAIACRYCRRRKIRCSGFEAAPDGRCGNCQRFHQECIFTPVSSQAQAFVPAHTAYPHLRSAGGPPPARGRGVYPPNPVIYGAHGQPLGQVPPPPPQNYQYQRFEENPEARGPPPQRRGSAGEFYPDPNSLPAPVSPAGSSTSYQSAFSQPPHSTYYPPAPQRSSPQSTYSYEHPSPGSNSTASPAYPYPNLHPPQVLPPQTTTPPPPGQRGNSMSISNLIGDSSRVERNPTDSNMLNALNRRGMS